MNPLSGQLRLLTRLQTEAKVMLCSVMLILAAEAQGVSESLWEIRIPSLSFTNTPMSEVFHSLESESKQRDVFGRAVRIFCDEAEMGRTRLTVSLTNCSLRAFLETVLGDRCFFTTADAVVLSQSCMQGAYRTAPIFGTCHDSRTGDPITDLTITDEEGCWPERNWQDTVTREDGRFIAYLCYCPSRLTLGGVGSLMREEADTINVVARSPGYEPRTYKLFVGDRCPPAYTQEPLNIILRRRSSIGSLGGLVSMIKRHGTLLWFLLAFFLAVLVIRQRARIKSLTLNKSTDSLLPEPRNHAGSLIKGKMSIDIAP